MKIIYWKKKQRRQKNISIIFLKIITFFRKEMKLYFSILLAFVIVGVQSYLINEYRHSTRDIEILNPHSTVVPNMYYVVVYDKDKDLVSSESLVGLQPGAMKIVHFLLKPQQDGQLLILIYKSTI